MTDIYKQHDTAFARVSGYVIAKDGERVATIAFKFPADGAGRLWAYVHWHTKPMHVCQWFAALQAVTDTTSERRLVPARRGNWQSIGKLPKRPDVRNPCCTRQALNISISRTPARSSLSLTHYARILGRNGTQHYAMPVSQFGRRYNNSSPWQGRE